MSVATTQIKNEPGPVYRWLVLFFVSVAMFGNYYIYDSVSPLADILAKQLNFTDADIGLLNAIYSVPNVFMVLIGGIIIDRLGTRLSSLIFSIMCLIGAGITAIQPDLTTMAIGRLIFGLGAESLIVAVTTVLARWFKGKELSFAFGLNLTLARLGTFAALNSPTWARGLYDSWQGPMMISIAAGVISAVGVAIYWFMDAHAEKRFRMAADQKQDEIVLRDIFKFNASFWFISLLCVTFYSAVFPFQTFAVKFFIENHLYALPESIARSMGGFLSSLLILSTMILTPLFGLLADKIGKRALLMMIGSVFMMPVYLVLVYVPSPATVPAAEISSIVGSMNDSSSLSYFFQMIKILFSYYPNLVIPMGVLGLSFSLIPAVMWPSVAYIVEGPRLGTAYGLMTMIQNIGLAGFNFLIGWVNDLSGNYTAGMWIFTSLGFFGLLFAFLLRRAETGVNGHNLELGMADQQN